MSDSITLTVSKDYGYVLLAASSTFLLNFWLGVRVGQYRRAAKVPYPHPYAYPNSNATSNASPSEKAETEKAQYLFNCAQRGHANFIENQPTFLASMLISGLQYPVATAVCGVGWSVSRVLYAVGYTRTDKSNGSGRLLGLTFWLFQLGTIGMGVSTAVNMIRG